MRPRRLEPADRRRGSGSRGRDARGAPARGRIRNAGRPVTRIDLSDPAAIRREGAAWPWRIAFLVFATLLLIATHWPASEPSGNNVLSPDKLVHFLCFGGFTFLLWMTRWFRRFWVVALYSIAFTVLDEISQGFFSAHRDTSGADIAAGLLGVFAASAWMTTFQPADHFVTRQQEKQVIWVVDELLARPANWFLLGGAFVVPMLIVFLPLYILGWKTLGISVGNITLTLGILVGLAALGVVLRRILPDYLRRIETDRPCFECGVDLSDLELDADGSGHCGACTSGAPFAMGPAAAPRIPLATVLQADGALDSSASPATCCWPRPRPSCCSPTGTPDWPLPSSTAGRSSPVPWSGSGTACSETRSSRRGIDAACGVVAI